MKQTIVRSTVCEFPQWDPFNQGIEEQTTDGEKHRYKTKGLCHAYNCFSAT